jgi:hypothetical protein
MFLGWNYQMLKHFEKSWLLCGFGFYVEGAWGHKNKNT